MQVQIVRASTRHRALAEARRLMGPDPLVLSVRRRPGSRGEDEWEALVARDTPEPVAARRGEAEAPPWEELERLRADLAELKESIRMGRTPNAQLLTLAHRLGHIEAELLASVLKGQELPTRWAPLVQRLEAAGYPTTDALRVVQRLDRTTGAEPEPDWRAHEARVREALAEDLSVAPAEERLEPGLVVFTGGAGVGKTTLAAKLAADLCLGGAQSPVLGVMKPKRGVGLETVRRCATALGIEFVEVRSTEQLEELEQRAADGPVILDSPAVNPLDVHALDEMGRWLRAAPSAEVHIVVSARYADEELSRAIDAAAFAPKRRLCATHLDEAPYLGRVMAAAARSRVPIGYLSLGPRIPDDLSRPGVESLIDSVLKTEGSRLSS